MIAAWLLMNLFFFLLLFVCCFYCVCFTAQETLTFGSESETLLLGDLNPLSAC